MELSTQYFIKIEAKSSNINKDFCDIINSFDGFTILDPVDPRTPNLMILEIGEPAQKEMEHVEELLSTEKTGEIFLTSDYADTNLLKKAMRIGVNEFFSQPIDKDEVIHALERFQKRNHESISQNFAKNGQVLTVFGSKGGVGTTTLAVNIATSIKQSDSNKSVAIIDLNTLFGEIPLFLEILPQFHWGEITKNIERLDTTFLSNILSTHKSGVKVLPSPAYLNGHINPTPSVMIKLLGLMRQMFEFIIIDGGQSIDDTSLKVLELSDSVILITILSLPCLANTNKLIKSFTRMGYVRPERIKVILNRNMKKSEISLHDAEEGIGQEIYWTIPNDFGTSMASINNGEPLLEVAPKAMITQSIIDLAESFLTSKETKSKKRWSLFKN